MSHRPPAGRATPRRWAGVLWAFPLAGIWLGGCMPPAPIPAEALALAERGVAANSEWKPAVREVEGFRMALIPAGCFRMGSTESELEAAFDSCRRYFGVYAADRCGAETFAVEQPAHQVCFEEPFWLDVVEVTNRAYGSSSSTDMVSMYRDSDWPRETVTWDQAAAFCAGRGMRLPTEAEWEYAARGPDGRAYPWGEDYDSQRVIMGVLNPQEAGSAPGGASWAGVHDLSGGIEEWTADWFGSYPADRQIDPVGPDSGTVRVVRGGSWFSFAPFQVRAAHRQALDPNHASSTVGFRCAADAGADG